MVDNIATGVVDADFSRRALHHLQTTFGQDCFVLLPTGGGKSLCYALPAVMGAGVVIVVSPLIALMENQVAGLQAKRIPCDFVSSTRSPRQRDGVFEDLSSPRPELKLVFVTPELIDTDRFKAILRRMHQQGTLALFAIDEAHCISSWGHDFRPAYCKLASLRQLAPGIPIMALTATAASTVQADILASLQLRDPVMLVSSFNRPNIHYTVLYTDFCGDGYAQLRKLLEAPEGVAGKVPCAIIYTCRRDTASQIAARLTADGLPCAAYHAALKDGVRSRVLAEWQSGQVPIVAATVAFGMGIDKQDVRTVVHYNLPSTVEGFYQESGRAGRDGKPARSVVLYSTRDQQRMEYILQQEQRKGGAEGGPRKRRRIAGAAASNDHAADAFARVVEYCTSPGCRRAFLLAAFGEKLTQATACAGGCDYCRDPQLVQHRLGQLAERQRVGNATAPAANLLQPEAWVRFAGGRANTDQDGAEGLDGLYDSSGGEEEEDPIEDDSEDDNGHKEAATLAAEDAAATAAKRAGGRAHQFLAAMMAAERQHEKSQHSTDRDPFLAKLSGAANSAKTTAALVDAACRARACEQLATALRSNGALQLATTEVASLAKAAEHSVFAPPAFATAGTAQGHAAVGTHSAAPQDSRSSYQARLNAVISRIATSRCMLEVPGAAACTASNQLPCTLTALASSLAAVAAVPCVGPPVHGDVRGTTNSCIPAAPAATGVPPPSAHLNPGGSSTSNGSSAGVARRMPCTAAAAVPVPVCKPSAGATVSTPQWAAMQLQHLAQMPVTADLLQATELGKVVRCLAKRCAMDTDGSLQEAAKRALDAWTARLTKRSTKPPAK